MRIIKGIKVVGFVFLFIVINLLLSYLLVKANGPSEVMWKDFRKTEKIDTVYLGSSFSQMTFNPYIIDEATGWSSFNMGTPGPAVGSDQRGINGSDSGKKDKEGCSCIWNPVSGTDTKCKCESHFCKGKKVWMFSFGKTAVGLEVCDGQ